LQDNDDNIRESDVQQPTSRLFKISPKNGKLYVEVHLDH